MSYGLGWQADGDLGFSIGTSLGGIGLTLLELMQVLPTPWVFLLL